VSTGTIEVGVSHGRDPHTAVEDALDQLSEDPNLALVFFSPRHADEIEAALEQLPDECHSLGCSTAGELTPDGYTQGEVVVALVRSPYLALETHRITFESNDPRSAREAGRDFVLGAIEKLRDPGPCLDITFNAMLRSLRAGRPTRVLPYFMIELVDGLFPAIDYYVDGINEVIHRFNFLEVYGGAAGDDLRLERTYTLENGELCPEHSAVVVFGGHRTEDRRLLGLRVRPRARGPVPHHRGRAE